MKARVHNPFLLPVLFIALSLMPAGRAAAQTFTNLHSFSALVSTTNGEGANPSCSLILVGNGLYGTTEDGGTNASGALFAINPNTAVLTNIHIFAAITTNGLGQYTNSDGGSPSAGLLASGNTLYGTAEFGGLGGEGTIFSVHPDGTGFTNLHSFAAEVTNSVGRYTNSDGQAPQCALVLSGNTLYGTASGGGSFGNGTVFRINADGTGFTNLHSFTTYSSGFPSTNSDGYYPVSGVIVIGNTLYGTAVYGSVYGRGAVFRVNTDGTGFTNLHSFTFPVSGTNADGILPFAGLAVSGNTLYGATDQGGSKSDGIVFALNTDGSGFTNLYNFTGYPLGAQNPQGGLIVSGHTLYGTTEFGGSGDNGVVFMVNTDGSGFTNLYKFSAALGTYPNYYNADGYNPYASLLLSGNTLYGTTLEGGTGGAGVVFAIALPALPGLPQLSIMPSGGNVILTWPTNAVGFTLQSNTNLEAPAGWSAVSPAPVVVNTNNAVTNSVSGMERYFRLEKP